MTTTQNKILNDAPFLSHLRALRFAFIRLLASLTILFGICAYFAKDLYQILSLPMRQILPAHSFFIAIHPLEAWLTYLKTALGAACFFAAPHLLYEIWRFVSPGLYTGEKRSSIAFVSVSSILFLTGALFGYFVVFPIGFSYFTTILNGTDIQFMPLMTDYLSFAIHMLLAFGLVFEIPIVVFYLAVSGWIPLEKFIALQKYFLILSFVIGAILTPPDIVSQTLMSVPIFLLYEGAVFCAWIFLTLKKKQLASAV